jgi:hypothetical protein
MHLTAIIPLTVAMFLLALEAYKPQNSGLFIGIFLLYGVIAHLRNVRATRQAKRWFEGWI